MVFKIDNFLLAGLFVTVSTCSYAVDRLQPEFDSNYLIEVERCSSDSAIFDRDNEDDFIAAVKDGGNPSYSSDLSPIESSHNSDEKNINGPSVIYWNDPGDSLFSDSYYMFFAHHEGRSIRVARSDSPCGPWDIIKSPKGVAGINNISFFNNGENNLYNNGIQDSIDDHVASPDVHQVNGTLYMYVHGKPGGNGSGQRTLLLSGSSMNNLKAVSSDFGHPYLRHFQVNDYSYALTKNNDGDWGLLFQNDDNGYSNNFTKKAKVIDNMRHGAVLVDGERVLLFYSVIGDNPEHIKFVEINTFGEKNPKNWSTSYEQSVLLPQYSWEGAGLNTGKSAGGVSYTDVEQVRDPAIFIDPVDGQVYMYYSVRGEAGIAAAKLTINRI